ncbi:MAG: SpoIIE family protein phosphatase [Armatimonadota bacterium]
MCPPESGTDNFIRKSDLITGIISVLSSADDAESRTQEVLRLLDTVFPCNDIAIGIKNDEWHVFLSHPFKSIDELNNDLSRIYTSLTSASGQNSAAQYIEDPDNRSIYMPVPGRDGIRGILFLKNDKQDPYSQEDIDLIRIAASVTGSFVDNRSERKDNPSSESLTEEEQCFRFIFEQAPVGMAMLSLDFQFIRINSAFSKITGYSEEEILRKYLADITYPEDMADEKDDLSALRQGEIDIYRTDKRYVRNDGGISWARVHAKVIRNADGTPMYFFAVIADIMENRKAEEALKASEEKYRLLVESANSIILQITTSGILTYINKYGLNFFGYEEEELIGHNVIDKITPKTDSTGTDLSNMIKDITIHPELYINNENENIRKNGERVWVAWTNHPICSKDGNIVEVLSVGIDITARKRAEDELRKLNEELERRVEERTSELAHEVEERKHAEDSARQSEQILRHIFEILPVGIWIMDKSGKIISGNQTGQRIWGGARYVEPEGFGEYKGWWADTGKQISADEWAAARAIRNGETSINEHIEIETFDGKRKYILNSAIPITDENNNIAGAVVVNQDITEIKKTEQALRKSEEAYKALAENSPDIISRFDKEGRYTYINPIMEQIIGIPKKDIIGKINKDMPLSAYRINKLAKAFLDVINTGKQKKIENEYPTIQGKKNLQTILVPEKSEDGNIQGVLAITRDITELVKLRKGAEQALEREQHYSRLLQRALLPSKPVITKGYSIAYIYVPAFASREVGGDFYDVFTTEKGKCAIIIGDVSGKGLESASIAADARSTVRSFAYDLPSPGQALTHANSVLYAALQSDNLIATFATVLLVMLDTAKGKVHYSSSGHPPAVIIHNNGTLEYMESHHPPLGVLNKYTYTDHTCRLDYRETMVLYTDGISESRNGEGMFGIEGIDRTLKEHGNDSAIHILNALLKTAKDWSHGKLKDDAAIIVIQRLKEDNETGT